MSADIWQHVRCLLPVKSFNHLWRQQKTSRMFVSKTNKGSFPFVSLMTSPCSLLSLALSSCVQWYVDIHWYDKIDCSLPEPTSLWVFLVLQASLAAVMRVNLPHVWNLNSWHINMQRKLKHATQSLCCCSRLVQNAVWDKFGCERSSSLCPPN